MNATCDRCAIRTCEAGAYAVTCPASARCSTKASSMTSDDENQPARPSRGSNHPHAASGESGVADPNRRRFMALGIVGAGTCVAGVVVAPAVPFVLHPLWNETVRGGEQFVPVGRADAIRRQLPVAVELFADRRDAWNREVQAKIGSAWVVELDGELAAFSTVCPHLGCAVDYDPAAGKFRCPCHKSSFRRDGMVEGGPSPRGLDRLELETEGGLVQIRYQRFRQGVSEKEPV